MAELTGERWYELLKKPSWAPQQGVFSVAWTILYPLIFGSFGYTAYTAIHGVTPRVILAPIVVNLVANFGFTSLQLRLRRNDLALLDGIVLVGSLIWFIAVIAPLSTILAVVQIPYLIWASFVLVLQFAIVRLNGRRTRARV